MPDENVLTLMVSSKGRTQGAKWRGRQWVVKGLPSTRAGGGRHTLEPENPGRSPGPVMGQLRKFSELLPASMRLKYSRSRQDEE